MMFSSNFIFGLICRTSIDKCDLFVLRDLLEMEELRL